MCCCPARVSVHFRSDPPQPLFALIETAYSLLENGARVDADFLPVPELTYGAALLILICVTVLWHRAAQADIIGNER